MGWAVRVGTAVAAVSIASGPGWGGGVPVRLESVTVGRAAGHVVVVVATDRPCRPEVSTVHAGDRELRRVYVDFPAGTTLARGVPGSVAGVDVVRRVGVGRTAAGGVRVAIDVEGAARLAVRRPPTGHGLAIVLPSPEPIPAGEAPPDVAGTSPAAPQRRLRVVLDPGHGGDDPGASSTVEEKRVTLAIARELAGLLRAGLGAEVTLTRDVDASISLRERTRRANAAHGDLFVSIHANASPRPATHGIETYYLDNTDDQATLRLASIENAAGAGGRGDGTDLDYILSSLVQGGKQEPSTQLARAVQHGIVERLRADWPRIVDLGVKRGPFYVLVGVYMPCVLVEASFLTHPEEARRLADPAYRRAIAEGIYRGIAAFAAARADAGTL